MKIKWFVTIKNEGKSEEARTEDVEGVAAALRWARVMSSRPRHRIQRLHTVTLKRRVEININGRLNAV